MDTVIDFHSHILPGIDDGSRSVSESVSMLQLEAEQGIRHVIVTPHFYANYDSPERFLRRRKAAHLQLLEELDKYEGLPEIRPAAEVYFFPGISESEILPELTIAGTKYILVEMPESPWSEAMYRELERIYVNQGLTPVIAHIDRYISPFRTHKIPERLEKLPVMIQANTEFFLTRSTSRMALRMLKEGRIHLLGSDCHNLKSRVPNMGQALTLIEKKLGSGMIRQIQENQQIVLGRLPVTE